MRDLGARADLGVLGLGERADLGALGELGGGPQVGEGADLGALADGGLVDVAAHDGRALADDGVGQGGVGADLGARVDGGGALELASGADEHVRGDLDGDVDPGGVGVFEGDAGLHQIGVDAVAQDLAQPGELGAVVARQDLGRVVAGDRADGAPGLAGEFEDVGEVLLALVVGGGDLPELLAQDGGVEGVGAGVDLADGELLGVGVAVLDVAQDRAVGVADDAAEAGGVVDDGGQDGGGVAGLLVGLHEPPQGVGAQQRGVAAGDDDRALEVGDGFEGDAHGVPGAQLLGLEDRLDVGGVRFEVRGHLVGGGADDHDAAVGADGLGAAEHVAEQRPPEKLVEDLGFRGFHASAKTCGQDDRRTLTAHDGPS